MTEAEIQVASAAVRGAPYAFRSEGAQNDFGFSYHSPKNFGLDLLALGCERRAALRVGMAAAFNPRSGHLMSRFLFRLRYQAHELV